MHGWLAAALALGAIVGMLLGTTPAQANEGLVYDARGNIQSRTVDGRPSTYRYDKLDRLRQETGRATQSFTLDENGNRTADGQATYTVLANGNRLVTRNGVALTYDPAGNLLQDQTRLNGATVTRTFTYGMAGHLKTVSIGGNLVATYTHNHLAQRTRKVLANPPPGTPATTLYRYDPNGRLVEEIAASAASAPGISVSAGQSLVTYAWLDDIPAAVIWAPNSPGNPGNPSERIVYLHADHLNTPRKATDEQARVVWTWESDAFGATAANEDPDGDGIRTVINLRFPGQYFDAESGLHYNWHRHYDPQSGRYTQSDPIGLQGGINSYSYGLGNALSNIDPDGRLVFALPAIPLLGEATAAAVGIGLAWWMSSAADSISRPDPLESRARDRRRSGTVAANVIEGLRRNSESCPPPMSPCEKQEAEDNKICGGLPWADGSRRRCYASAAKRLAACEAGRPVETLSW